MGGVIIDPNIRKQAVRLDINGNVIDPRTKQVIQPKEEPDYKPTREQIEAQINATPIVEEAPKDRTLSERIEDAKATLVALEHEKQAEITRLKEEMEKLQNE